MRTRSCPDEAGGRAGKGNAQGRREQAKDREPPHGKNVTDSAVPGKHRFRAGSTQTGAIVLRSEKLPQKTEWAIMNRPLYGETSAVCLTIRK